MDNIKRYTQVEKNESKFFKDLLEIYIQDLDYSSTIAMIQSFYSEKFSLMENQIFIIDQNEMKFEQEFNSSQNFLLAVKNLEENGVIDWISKNPDVRVIPNLDVLTYKIFPKFVVVPIILGGTTHAIFIASLINDEMERLIFKFKDLQNLISLSFLIISHAKAKSTQLVKQPSENFRGKESLIAFSKIIHNSFIRSAIDQYSMQLKLIKVQMLMLENNSENISRRVKVILDSLEDNIKLNELLISPVLQSNNFIYKERIELQTFLDDFLKKIDFIFKKSNIQIEKQFESTNTMILINLYMLETSLIAIIQNAIESFSNEGKIRILLYDSDKRHCVLSIQDNGGGISEELLPKVTNLFMTTKKESEHIGLGLYFVNSYARSQHFKFSITSEEQIGTTVKLTIPKLQQ
ncbi:HAMP domain-containing histidine kinase [bacterium]|nr:HAMP domain-containing histidine kinase [bacterium]